MSNKVHIKLLAFTVKPAPAFRRLTPKIWVNQLKFHWFILICRCGSIFWWVAACLRRLKMITIMLCCQHKQKFCVAPPSLRHPRTFSCSSSFTCHPTARPWELINYAPNLDSKEIIHAIRWGSQWRRKGLPHSAYLIRLLWCVATGGWWTFRRTSISYRWHIRFIYYIIIELVYPVHWKEGVYWCALMYVMYIRVCVCV